MFANRDNYEDVKKYYQGTYIKLVEDGDTIYFVKNVDNKYVYLQDIEDKVDTRLDLDVGYNLSYVMPRKTVYQYGKNAAMLSRIPARMWKKGMNKLNTQFMILMASGWVQKDFDIATIETFVKKPNYFTFNTIKEPLFSGELTSVALDSRFAINNLGMIYLDTTIVAKVVENQTQIVTRRLFTKDISRLFPNVPQKVLK